MHAVMLLQDRPPGGTAKPPQVFAATHMAMVEAVAEGEAYVERHADRGRD
jgi:DNA repair ATPase RecN